MNEEKIEPHEELADLLGENPQLNEEPAADLNSVETGEPKDEAAEEEPVEPVKDPEADPDPEPEKTVPPTEDDNDARVQALIAKGQDEVRKRQVLEGEMAKMQKQLQELTATQQPKIDPLEDPEGFAKQQQDNLAATHLQNKIELSEMMVKTQVGAEEYDTALAAFYEAAVANPALSQSMLQAPVPAKFAYDEGKRIISQKEIGDDPEAFKAALKEQIRAEILAELKPGTNVQEQKAVLPKTIANTGSGVPTAVDQTPDDSLDALLDGARKALGA